MKDPDKDFMSLYKSLLKIFTTSATLGTAASAGLDAGIITGSTGLLAIGAVSAIMFIVIRYFTKWIAMSGSVDYQLAKCEKFITECQKSIDKIDDPKIKKEIEKAMNEAKKQAKKVYNKLPDNIKNEPKYNKTKSLIY